MGGRDNLGQLCRELSTVIGVRELEPRSGQDWGLCHNRACRSVYRALFTGICRALAWPMWPKSCSSPRRSWNEASCQTSSPAATTAPEWQVAGSTTRQLGVKVIVLELVAGG